MLQQTHPADGGYILGHSSAELDRLIAQASYFGDLTAQVLRLAGLRPGMRVLDVGCGAGDVSFLAASIVGPTGAVVGVDVSPEAVALAERRAASAGLANVRFLAQDLAGLSLDEPVDALVGRLVLMYFPDPAAVLRRLTGLLAPGGLVVFHEFDLAATRSEPHCELFTVATERVRQALARAGADFQTGLRLSHIFQAAGLPRPQMIQGARVESGPDAAVYRQLTEITRTLLPLMERTGVATRAEVDIETLADRLREQAAARDSTLISPAFIGAWARRP
jgi:SAM-dependent methyltransferase